MYTAVEEVLFLRSVYISFSVSQYIAAAITIIIIIIIIITATTTK
jgi:hypothetical protein